MRPTALFLTLFGFYVALSGQIHNWFLMSVGAGCCLATTILSVHMGVCDDEGLPVRYWPRTIAYVPWLLWQIFLANIDVAKQVWRPTLALSPNTRRVPHSLKTGYGIATYANSITLTPGTVTIEADEDGFLVHALTKEAGEDVIDVEGPSTMQGWVRWIESIPGAEPAKRAKPPKPPKPDADEPADGGDEEDDS